jgi:hypothetical protein
MPMSDWHNWKVSVDQCHQKHIGPPPPLHRRIAYMEAHRSPTATWRATPLITRLTLLLRRMASFIRDAIELF